MTTEQELNEKLARWAGWYWDTSWMETNLGRWVDGHGGRHYGLPLFPHSLDACFRWLVPEANNRGYGVLILVDRFGVPWIRLVPEQGEVYGASDEHRKFTALALCRAIEQLIDKEGEDANRQ